MKNELLVYSVLAVALGAVAAGVTTTLFLSRDSSGHGGETLPPAVAPGVRPESDLSARIQELWAENQALQERVQTLELRPVPTARAPLGGQRSEEDLQAFQHKILARIAALEARRPAPADLEDQVADAVASLRKQETIESVRRSNKKKASRQEEWLTRMSGELGLDAYQVDELRSLYTRGLEQNEELTRMWEEGADEQILAEIKRANAEEQQAAFERILTPQQLEGYRGRAAAGRGK